MALALTVVDVETPAGPARAYLHRARAARAAVVLGHGAGRGVDTADLQGLAADLPAHGVTCVLVDQPWVLAGRRVASPPPVLDTGWSAVLAELRRRRFLRTTTPLVVGGRSAGARVACRTAVATGAGGLLLIAVPLLPPAARADPKKCAAALATRLAELALPAGLPVVVAQGERDAFGSAGELAAEARELVEVVAVPGADHGMRVARGGPDPRPVLLAAALLAVARAARE